MRTFVLCFFFLFINASFAQVLTRSLSSKDWSFRKKGDSSWMKATVPGTVHTDLFANKKIPDPFAKNNEKQLQWIEDQDWEYSSSFSLTQNEMDQSHIEIDFDGLDTYAKVFVNDSLVIDADNMFRGWRSDIKRYVHKGRNSLLVVFQSAVKKGREEAKKLRYVLPGEEKVFVRKAQYQFGWDWGPRFVTCGVWKDVRLNFWRDARILNVKAVQRSLTDSVAEMEFVCEINSDIDNNAYLEVIKGNKKDLSGQRITKIKLTRGTSTYSVFYTVKHPHLWWCNGMGKPEMYDFWISLSYDSRNLSEQPLHIGFRTIELVQERDSSGSSFFFKLNGKPVFIKGANYIPPDNFLPRVSKKKYESLVSDAVDANMNMLRVWGGGVYADDAFYEQCDKNGILVWQDFMFACAMYPGDEHFFENVAEEVIFQTERLRNHSCIAMWCGNNEVDEGWKNWGWQKQYNYSFEDSSAISDNNSILFNDFMRDLVNVYDGSRFYWPSSPSIGWGHKESFEQGDSHYWGVWWGMEPFSTYEKKVGRFMSEYGFQGMPSKSTLLTVGLTGFAKDRSAMDSSEVKILDAHQKHPSGFKSIDTYMERDYRMPKTMNDYVYLSQLLQARGMRTAIEAHRRARPYCMGTLYWQLNDCWPVVSWSSIDHNDIWKASHYQAKRSFEDVIISVHENTDSCDVYVVSDLAEDIKGDLVLKLFDLKGNLLFSKSATCEFAAGTSKVYCKISNAIINKFDKRDLVLNCELASTENSLTGTFCNYFFSSPKDLQLIKPNISIGFDHCRNVQCISVESDVVAKDIFISIPGFDFNFSDNYFDLLPGEKKMIYLPSNKKIKRRNKKRISLRSLADL